LKVLEGRSGPIVDDIRAFMAQTLGNPATTDAEMQAEWSGLMAELARVLTLGQQLQVIREVCDRIVASGATKYATALKQPVQGVVDGLLPDTVLRAWRMRRLATHLEAIDPHGELHKLAKERHSLEGYLSGAYRDIVVKRTWLKLAENASPSVRSALQAYLIAIKRIGKGIGVRAVRYRQDARNAAIEANPSVPCWIMPHYRVSETLPAELGCFDLVIIDEASQSDLTALPAILLGRQRWQA
ncbi:MAG TPA: hypothetical protein VIR57_16340, partial [Chloroflexota bacterium]